MEKKELNIVYWKNNNRIVWDSIHGGGMDSIMGFISWLTLASKCYNITLEMI